ncbi:MAG: guanylate kinase [Actinomycetota bacterium]|nr:guanylate kinase [Actinomycetota bacterium]
MPADESESGTGDSGTGDSGAPGDGRGVLLVLAGTSGAGKGTIGSRLRESDPALNWSVSWTTRARRAGEREGVDYHFVSREEFERLRDESGFLEWFEVYGDLKGTPLRYVVDELAQGHDVMLEIDVQGALAVKRALPEALLVFVQAPSRAEQRRRLESRGSETEESIARRLERAESEERIGAEEFDGVVVNDDVGQATAEVAAILAFRRARGRSPHGDPPHGD